MGDDEPNREIEATRDARAPRQRLCVRRFVLRGAGGAAAGKTFTSKGPRTVVGSHESADVVLDDRAVSRFHAEIVVGDGHITIRDLGSKNGTVVQGVPILIARLLPGATITVGDSLLRFELDDADVDVPTSARARFGSLVGSSAAMRALFAELEQAAACDANVLLTGETGTGKEAAAQSIHDESARRDGPFVVVDCGAIPPALLESELFGHERGAFTGAVAAREGAFEAAHGGTVFLDEIGELGVELQPKLLRVLERREVKRLGTNKVTPIDVRVIAATNRDLRQEVNAKRFRADLYYRLVVLDVRLPALRDRLDDVPELAEHLLEVLRETSPRARELVRSPLFATAVRGHPWPGNVRELRNYVERCLAHERELPLDEPLEEAQEAPEPADLSLPLALAREKATRAFESAYARGLLARHQGNVTSAARAAGVDRTTFHRLLRRVRSD